MSGGREWRQIDAWLVTRHKLGHEFAGNTAERQPKVAMTTGIDDAGILAGWPDKGEAVRRGGTEAHPSVLSVAQCRQHFSSWSAPIV